jgi:autotransporter-associated beta strand protein
MKALKINAFMKKILTYQTKIKVFDCPKRLVAHGRSRQWLMASLTLLLLFVGVSGVMGQAAGDRTWGANSNTAWYTVGNWSISGYPGLQGVAASNTNIATFTSAYTGTTPGINMGTASLNLGAISIDNTRTTALNIGNSSATAGSLRLYGATVNSVANTIVRNNGTGLLTLQAAQSGTMGVVLSNTTNNIINIDNTGGITISSIISGANPLTKTGTGAGTLALTGANTYTGTTTVSGGTLQLNRTGGTTIPITNDVTVASGGTLLVSTNQTLNNLTIATGGTLTVPSGVTLTINGTLATGASITNAGTIIINGTFQINQGGFGTGGTWTYGSSSTLVYNHTASTYGPITSSHSYWPASSGPTNVTIQGSTGNIDLGLSRSVSGIFQTAAGVTLSSSAVLTLTGTCQINAGGFFNSAPTYGAASTLIYNTGTAFGNGTEWTGNSTTAGVGVPQNVTIQNATTLNMPTSNRGIAGNLNITSGTLALNATSGDLYVAGNWTRAASQTFTPNNRAVFFNGTGTSTITGVTAFDYLIINKTSGGVTLANNISVNAANAGALTFTSGNIVTGSNKVSLASSSGVSRTSGHVVGNLERGTSTSNTTYTFDIGDATNYTPATITFAANPTAAGSLTASVTSGAHPNLATISSGLSTTKYVNRYWTITNSGTTFGSYNGAFTYVSGDLVGSPTAANLKVGKYDAAWSYPTASTATGTTVTTSGTAFTGFSSFALADGSVPVVSAGTGSNTYGTAGSFQIVATNSPSGYTATTLPTGMTLNSTSGLITVAATTAAGAYNITINASNAVGSGSSQTLTYNVNAKALTITGVTANNKPYDGTTAATLSGTAAYSGLVNSESFSVTGTPTASFATATVGTAKSVTVTGYTAPSANYMVTQPTGLTANITQKPLTISSAAASNKVYDGNTTVTLTGTLTGVVSPDVVTLALSGTFASSAVGTGIAVTSTSTISGAGAGNYTLTQPTGLSADITCNTPTITLGSNPSVCRGITSANLTYSGTTGTPNQYSVTYDATALTAGFANVTNATLPTLPIVLTVPAAAAAATYNATLTVTNSTTGCVSATSNITVTVNALPIVAISNKVDDYCMLGVGAVTVTGSGGTGALSITWTASANASRPVGATGSATGTPAGTPAQTSPVTYTGLTGWYDYNFLVTDSNGCTAPSIGIK